jgi:dTDP-4-amino-4,6-dideoxygalactose transaminase
MMNDRQDTTARERIYLSPPHMTGNEQMLIDDAFRSNWIAPLGPHVDAFEAEFAKRVGAAHAVALSSGTAGLHLAIIAAGIGRGDDVLTSTLTFSATINPICYVGAHPVLLDSELRSWNVDPNVLEHALQVRARAGKKPAAVLLVHLYGQSADVDSIVALCERYGVPLIEDAAEALGATYRDAQPGIFGRAGIFSFNGNRIITTSGGGMLVTNDAAFSQHVRKLATQAREPAPHYEHTEIGYNYRLSNVLAAIGRAQLAALSSRVASRRLNFEKYQVALGNLDGLTFQPEADWGSHTRWLTCIQLDPAASPVTPESLRLALESENIESRPLWKPMHMQPVFSGCEHVGGDVAEKLFANGLCLPSGSSLRQADLDRVIGAVRHVWERAPVDSVR